MKAALLRPLLHASTALLLLTLLGSWGLLRGVLLAAGLAAVGFEAVRLGVPSVRELVAKLVPVFRPEEARRPSGAGWLVVSYALVAWLPPPAPLAAVLAGALADPAAAMVGRRLGGGVAKSWPGTLAAFVVGTGALWLGGIAPAAATVAGVVAAALERWPGPFDDNLLIAPGVGLTVWWLVS